MRQITVIGSSGALSREIRVMAEELGRRLAERQVVLFCGGLGGVMEAACKGAKEGGGLTVGVLPGEAQEANRYVDIRVATGMGEARNVVNVRSGEAVIVLSGGAGTLSEIGLALKMNRRVVALRPSGGVASLLAGKRIDGQRILPAESVEEAVSLALGE